jgi:hypothetical protein
MSRLWTFAGVLTMMGCTIHSRKDLQDIETQLKHAISENETCLAWLKESDVYHRLDRTFILHGDDSYAATKTVIERNASDNEKMDLLRLNNLAAVCRKHNLENFGQVHPDFIALLAKWYAEDDALLVELLRDRLTIGHANQIVYARLITRLALLILCVIVRTVSSAATLTGSIVRATDGGYHRHLLPFRRVGKK